MFVLDRLAEASLIENGTEVCTNRVPGPLFVYLVRSELSNTTMENVSLGNVEFGFMTSLTTIENSSSLSILSMFNREICTVFCSVALKAQVTFSVDEAVLI